MKLPTISKTAITVTVVIVALCGLIALPALVLGSQTYLWTLTHTRQVKMLQADYSSYDNAFSLNPKP